MTRNEGNIVGIMSGKTCVVTGGAGSIGLAAASLLAREGARVMLVDRRLQELERAAAGLAAAAGESENGTDAGAAADRVAAVCADVSKAEATRASRACSRRSPNTPKTSSTTSWP